MSLYIGLMSGTSMDGIDAALVDITDNKLSMVSAATYPYPRALRARLLDAIDPGYSSSLHEFATLDMDVGNAFASAANALIETANTRADAVRAIGSHGQTLRHSPRTIPAYSIQIGNGPTIAAQTKITTVNDFRGIDIAMGGEGAPLVPAFHEWLFRRNELDSVVVNIGGIANVTILPRDLSAPVSGFDTGPGNCLMDEWCQKHLNEPYDQSGQWANQGVVSETLLDALSGDPYFALTVPKSTGREYFNAEWLARYLESTACGDLSATDVQATLLALTASTIGRHISEHAPQTTEVLVCGGGVFNESLMSHLAHHLPHSSIFSTAHRGVDPEVIEAAAFAWFAHCRLNETPVMLTTRQHNSGLVLGALHSAPQL